MDERVLIKRLALIKYLVTQGNNHSRMHEPINALSVISYHDAADLFLQLAAEELKCPEILDQLKHPKK